jgi:DNA repair protein RadC
MTRGDKAPNDLPEGLAAPARRALASAGYTSLDQLAKASEAEVRALHGMGPNAVTKLRSALRASGRSFARR